MKILCIDGGGIRGVFAATILEKLETDIGHTVSKMIDVVAGTSTGSIIAAAISIEKEMSVIKKGYIDCGAKIFERKSKLGLFRSIYSDHHLRHFIQKEFIGIPLNRVKVPLIIPAVDVTNGEPYIHRSYEQGKVQNIMLWDAVLSSCSAPIYFPPNQINGQQLAIDGGLWANNPSMVGLTEALHQFNKSLESISILSIGLGLQKINFTSRKAHRWGIENWLPINLPSLTFKPKLLDLALHLSSESISSQCQQLIGQRYLRLNASLGREVPFDEVSNMDWLIELGSQVYKDKRDEMMEFFFSP